MANGSMPPAQPNQPRSTGFAAPHAAPAPSAAAADLRRAAIASMPRALSLGAPRRVVDQGPVNCCVSCALTSAMELLHPAWPSLAPLFHYFVARFEERGADAKGFLRLQESLVTLLRHGVCDEGKHQRAFTEQDIARGPTSDARSDARQRRPRFPQFFRHLSGPSWVNAVRDELRMMRPVVMGIRLPMNYPERFLDARQEWTDPASPGLSDTGHCLLVTGFDDTKTALRIHDSQGNRFDQGSWWMGYRVVDGGAVIQACSIMPQA